MAARRSPVTDIIIICVTYGIVLGAFGYTGHRGMPTHQTPFGVPLYLLFSASKIVPAVLFLALAVLLRVTQSRIVLWVVVAVAALHVVISLLLELIVIGRVTVLSIHGALMYGPAILIFVRAGSCATLLRLKSEHDKRMAARSKGGTSPTPS